MAIINLLSFKYRYLSSTTSAASISNTKVKIITSGEKQCNAKLFLCVMEQTGYELLRAHPGRIFVFDVCLCCQRQKVAPFAHQLACYYVKLLAKAQAYCYLPGIGKGDSTQFQSRPSS